MECNSYTQAGTERCQINLFKDPKTREPNSFTVKKGNNIFLFKIPFGKKQQVNADTIFGTQCKLFIHEPKNSKEIDVENEDKELTLESSTIYRRQSTKKHVGRTLLKQFHTEFFYYLIYDSGLAICSMVSFELIKFLQVTNFPDELYIGADYDTRTSTLTLFTKLRVVEFLPKRESEEIWKHFVKVEDYKWAYESAKKYDLTFLQLVAFECKQLNWVNRQPISTAWNS
jgi:Pep3/Vps18/deep orange family